MNVMVVSPTKLAIFHRFADADVNKLIAEAFVRGHENPSVAMDWKKSLWGDAPASDSDRRHKEWENWVSPIVASLILSLAGTIVMVCMVAR